MGIEIPGWAGQLVIWAPYVLLAIVAVLFLMRRGDAVPSQFPGDIGRDGVPARRQQGWRAPPGGDGDVVEPVAAPAAHVPPAAPRREEARDRQPAAPVGTAPSPPAPPPPAPRQDPMPTAATAARAPQASAAGDAGRAPAPTGTAQRVPSLAEIEGALQRAEAEGRDKDIAALSLYLARRRKAEGLPYSVESIRKCIRLAVQLGLKELHGEARLELGDDARIEGDLTTACEHWQIARALFEEAELPAKRDNAEARMKRFGCPTDWVLNDF